MKFLNSIDGADKLVEDTSHRLVSDTEKAIWNGITTHTSDLAGQTDSGHVKRNNVTMTGTYANAEGDHTTAAGYGAHAEGIKTTAVGDYSHAAGIRTMTNTKYATAIGRATTANHGALFTITASDDVVKTLTLNKVTGLVVGDKLAIVDYSTLNDLTRTYNMPIAAIDGLIVTLNTTETITSTWVYAIKSVAAVDQFPTYAEGDSTVANGDTSHAEGFKTFATGTVSHAEGGLTTASGDYSHAEGRGSVANGYASHAKGFYSHAYGYSAYAEGYRTYAITDTAHAEGDYTLACHGTIYTINTYNDTTKVITLYDVTGLVVGDLLQIKYNSYSAYVDIPIAAIDGLNITLTTTLTINTNWKYAIKKSLGFQYPTHAEGYNTVSAGKQSHAEGYSTIASGANSHTQGENTTANGDDSHAEGYYTVASGTNAHAQGNYTIAQGISQTAIGEFNIAQGTWNSRANTDHAFIVGNGTSTSARSNALTVDWSGNVDIASGAAYKVNGTDILTNRPIIKFKQGTTDFTTTELAVGEIGFLYE